MVNNGKDEALCKSCGAPIYWVFTTLGRKMPIDREKRRMVVQGPNGWEVRVAYRSHFATCPNADEHRKAKP